MCGIVAALPTYPLADGELPDPATLTDALPGWPVEGVAADQHATTFLQDLLARSRAALDQFSSPGAQFLLFSDDGLRRKAEVRCRELLAHVSDFDAWLDSSSADGWEADTVERVQALVADVADQLWTVLHDRVGSAERAHALAASAEPTRHAAISYAAIETVLAAVDRLEVRGRDSAGVSIWVHLGEADRTALTHPDLVDRQDPLLRNGSLVRGTSGVCFTYKRAAVVGRLGDNVAALREAIRSDRALHRLVALPSARVTVLAHTRWASVGRISEANAHPVDSRDLDGRAQGPYVLAALNGDIDNHASLRAGARCPADDYGISTDAKIIPVMLSDRLTDRMSVSEAMVASLADFAGSMAIAVLPDSQDGELVLAAKGSGQNLYVGTSSTGYVVVSEPYGLVATSRDYLQVDGATWEGSRRPGTVVRLTRDGAGSVDAIERWDGDGVTRPVDASDVKVAEITTRDLALGTFSHFLEKEMHEAPASFRKTLRGRLKDDDDGLLVALPDSSFPSPLREKLRAGELRDIVVIGQGTAAVACQGIAELMRGLLGSSVNVSATPATEFSAWRLDNDMTGVCVVAVSQSGTTTDTNRSVDLARERGATVVAIVNRRDSALVAKSDGVLYTSDGRDVEISVASTKAFYSQIAAGCLLAVAVAKELGQISRRQEASLLSDLAGIPDHLMSLHSVGDKLAQIATDVATRYPYWAVVGSGPNAVAAAEVRIKLSELCYKTISVDAVEDKKHIDLSAEALVVVCVAGASPNTVSDLVKEVEILAAHRNKPIVLCDEDTKDLWPGDYVIGLPRTRPELAWILATAAGHLFAYQAAHAIDRSADDLRAALAALEEEVDDGRLTTTFLPRSVLVPVERTLEASLRGDLRGVLSSQTATRLACLAMSPRTTGVLASLAMPEHANDLLALARTVLTEAIDELSRPIDSVRHQAKTVTVGTSRSDVDVYDNPLVQALDEVGALVTGLTLPTLRVLRAHAALVEDVSGATHYRIEHGPDGPVIRVTGKVGLAAGVPSRADDGAPLTGSKGLVVEKKEPRLLRGLSDGRIVLAVPEQDGAVVSGLTVLHVRLEQHAPLDALVAALGAERMAEITAAATETNPEFRPDDLAVLPVEDVLLLPVETVVERLRKAL